MSDSAAPETLFPAELSVANEEGSRRVMDLVGRTLDRIEVSPLGVRFHFGPKNGDTGVVYWAYGGTKS